MNTRRDFSCLVMLDLAPSEATDLAQAIEALRILMRAAQNEGGSGLSKSLDGLLKGITSRLELQLKELQWPGERSKPPYPV